MCGLVGFLTSNFEQTSAEMLLRTMTDKLAHRGPDADGVWFDPHAQIGLGHRRLSIMDLSPAGAQPMHSLSGRYAIVFNGEIYNHLQLRKDLSQGLHWNGHSDTETLLTSIEAWGLEKTIERSVGMFAFALWDKKDQVLTLGRDRLGEKPLYYGWQQQHFLFASELSALRAHPGFNAEVNRDALALLMRNNTIAAPYSIWNGIYKLMPGSFLTVSQQKKEPVISHYWSAKNVVESGVQNRFQGSPQEATVELESLLSNVIEQQMIADVPIGAFLSGGVDSSLIVALMQKIAKNPVRTFSIGFNEKQYNEAIHAKNVARHLGTEHTELYVSAQDALMVIPQLATMYDEPFADSSQIPTALVSKLAKQQVTVSLSGDGGDELFCGYNRYVMADQLWNKLSLFPIKMRTMLGKGILSTSPAVLNYLGFMINCVVPKQLKMRGISDKIHKGASVMGSESLMALYYKLVSHWINPSALVIGSNISSIFSENKTAYFNVPTDIEYMMATDMINYLPNDILTKVDRAAMYHSLETRVPFLDHRVVDFAWKLPLSYKLNNGVTKWVLREILYKHVPKNLIERPKMGFGVPLDAWLRGPLRDWAEDLLNETRLKNEGYFNVSMVRDKWNNHLKGNLNGQYLLWDVLMFQSWLENNQKSTCGI